MLIRGFTLIEVLVTLVILMFGLLGIAGLMAKGQRASFEAFQRQQALSLANDMAERQRANRTQATVYRDGARVGSPLGLNAKHSLLGNSIIDCGRPSTRCSPADLAAYDLAQWDGLLFGYTETANAARVGGIANALGCIEEIANTIAVCAPTPAPAATLYTRTNRISVAWQGHDDTGVLAAAPSTCGSGRYGASDGWRRIVALDVLLEVQCP
jgi:type IV pilus assembly protein PilV